MYRFLGLPRSRRLYRVAVVVAALSLAHGIWNVFVEHDRRPGIFWQLLLPLLVLRLSLSLYQRSRSA